MTTDIRDLIVATIREVLSHRGSDATEVDDSRRLFADGLGLDSLDFATVVIRLEQQTGTDPFRTGQVNRPPATVGELVAVYEPRADNGQSEAEADQVSPAGDRPAAESGPPVRRRRRRRRETLNKPDAIEAPVLDLRHCSIEEHCTALRNTKRLPFWWYLGTSRVLGNFSIPFQDGQGRWWYQVKPGLSWPVDFFGPIPRGLRLPLSKAFLGYQHVVDSAADANSRLVINAITALEAFGPSWVDAKRRNSVRKGLKSCQLRLLTRFDQAAFDECRLAWDDLTERTGWKHRATPEAFDETWRMMLDCPGVSILVGHGPESGRIVGFLVIKIIGDTAYVDTIASRTEDHHNVNDALVYSFLANAQELAGVTKAHFAIRSYVHSLERFKTSMGFKPIAFPAMTRLRGPARLALKWLYPANYRRMIGEFDDAEPSGGAAPGPSETGS